jgi:outer membrane lipoprotein carrier protein
MLFNFRTLRDNRSGDNRARCSLPSMRALAASAIAVTAIASAAFARGLAVASNTVEPAATAAQPPPQTGSLSLEQVVTRLQRRYDATRSLRASFSEELSSPGGMKRTRTGTVSFRKGGRMRWEFGEPRVETIVSDGQTVYDYEPDLNQVVEVPVSKALKTSATAFLLGLGNLKRDFTAALPADPPADGLVHLALSPKGGGDQMELGLDPQNYNIVKFKLTDQVGNVTELHFRDIQTNLALEDSLFRFAVPPDADIVQPGQQ